MGKHEPKDPPTTGNGNDQGQKPEAKDCAQRLKNGVLMIKQPSNNWARTPQPTSRVRNKWFS